MSDSATCPIRGSRIEAAWVSCVESWRTRQLSTQLTQALAQTLARMDAAGLSEDDLVTFMDALAPTGAPDRVLEVWGEVLAREDLTPHLQHAIVRTTSLADQGDHPFRALIKDDALLTTLFVSMSFDADAMSERLDALLEPTYTAPASLARDATLHALRVFKRRESLALYAREVDGSRSVREMTRGIANLAILATQAALAYAARSFQRADLLDHVCVLGMGKLGGLELNYSSDIDLILLCSDACFEDAEARDLLEQIAREAIALMNENTRDGYVFRVDLRLRPEGDRGLLVPSISAMTEYYLSWGRTWERSAMLKARPIAGNLALGESLLARLEPFLYRKYLDFQVLDDLREMKAMVNRNARLSSVIGVREEPGEDRAQRSLSTSSSSSSLGKGLASSISSKLRRRGAKNASSRLGKRRARAMASTASAPPPSGPPSPRDAPEQDASREEIALWASPGGLLGWDVKIGAGGIREIEFFVQALQLIHCGTRPALRVRGTLDALDRLLYSGLVSSEDHESLGDAYDLYRRLEHRIQMRQDRQLHRMPDTRGELESLARRMGMSILEMEARVASARERVSEIFGRLFRESAQKAEEPTLKQADSLSLEVVLAARGEEVFDRPVLDALREAGFTRPRQIAGQLQILSDRDHGPYGARATTRDKSLGQFLLRACASCPDPERAFGFVTRLITTVGDRDWFYRMLGDNPHAAQLLVHVFGTSDYLSTVLMKDPNVIARLLAGGEAVIFRDGSQMREELAMRLARIEDPSHRLGRVHSFQQEETLRLAIHSSGGAVSIEDTNSQLGQLGEVVLEQVTQEIWSNLRRRAPEAPEPLSELPFCVLGMGKLGGLELGFGSDLDLVFVYERDEARGLTHALFANLAQRLVRALSTLSASGRLYDVDTRLRPSGGQGTLVVSVEALRDYHASGRASLWERQAMIRARPLTGTEQIRHEIGLLRHAVAFHAPLPDELASEFVAMREKMRAAAPVSEESFDIKSSAGGLIDIEFMTQYMQLCLARDGAREEPASAILLGHELDEGVRSQNTRIALGALIDTPRFEHLHHALAPLPEDYSMLRRLEAMVRINTQRGQTVMPTRGADARELARRVGFHGEEAHVQLEHAVSELRARVRLAWSELLLDHAA